MLSSRREKLWLVLGAALASGGVVLVVACNQVAGLDDFTEVDCTRTPCTDAGPADVVVDARIEDAAPDVVLPDGNIDAGPISEHRLWAHWRMPNADAAVAPDGAAPLPNQMSYDAGGLGAGNDPAYVTDNVTQLQWLAKPMKRASASEVDNACAGLKGGWRVPTRIELVTLIDVTRANPAMHPLFINGGDSISAYASGGGGASGKKFWSSSPVAGPSPGQWTVDFETAQVSTTDGDAVRCVRGGPAR